jgi:DNA-binding ferritin-like protein
MSNQELINDTVKFFFSLQLNIKIYHWNTTSFARHKASDEFGGKLSSLIDRFVEVFVGRYKVKPSLSNIKIDSEFLTDEGSEKLLIKSRDYLEFLSKVIKDTDLLTIRDELLSEVNQTLYLYQLK